MKKNNKLSLIKSNVSPQKQNSTGKGSSTGRTYGNQESRQDASDEKDVGVFSSLITVRRCHKDAFIVRRTIPYFPCSHEGWSFGLDFKAYKQFFRIPGRNFAN